MTYQEIQAQLKEFKAQGYENIPALNSKKEVLEAALNAILVTEATSPAPVKTKKTASPKAIKARKANGKKLAAYNAGHLDFVIEENEPAPVQEITEEEIATASIVNDYGTTPSVETTAKKLDFTTANYYPAFLTALATIVAFLQSLWTKSAPYLEKAVKYIQTTLLPKLALASRFIGLVVLLATLKAVRRVAIV